MSQNIFYIMILQWFVLKCDVMMSFSFFLRNEFWMIKHKQFNENKLFVGSRMLTIICVFAWHVSMICIILWGHEKRHKIELRDMKYLIALSHFLTLILQKYLRSVTIHYTIEQLYTFLNFPLYIQDKFICQILIDIITLLIMDNLI